MSLYYTFLMVNIFSMHIADKYATVMNSVNDALEYGKSGAECSAKYHW